MSFTINKTIDIRVDDYDVEIEIDEDDLSEIDSDTLWSALQNASSSSEIAEFVSNDSDTLAAVLRDTPSDVLIENVDDATLTTVASEFAHSDGFTLDMRKEACVHWLSDETSDADASALRAFLAEQLGTGGVPRDALSEMLAALRDPRGLLVADVVAALVRDYGAGLVIGHAVAAIERSCVKSQS